MIWSKPYNTKMRIETAEKGTKFCFFSTIRHNDTGNTTYVNSLTTPILKADGGWAFYHLTSDHIVDGMPANASPTYERQTDPVFPSEFSYDGASDGADMVLIGTVRESAAPDPEILESLAQRLRDIYKSELAFMSFLPKYSLINLLYQTEQQRETYNRLLAASPKPFMDPIDYFIQKTVNAYISHSEYSKMIEKKDNFYMHY